MIPVYVYKGEKKMLVSVRCSNIT